MSAQPSPPSPDVASLLEDWERMSARFLSGRAELLAQAIDWLRATQRRPAIVEIGAGPGTTLRAVRRTLPTASLVGLDHDPVLLELQRMSTPASESIVMVRADLSDASWVTALPVGMPATAVIALQVLHYFPPDRFAQVLAEIHDLLEPGGVFVHIDAVPASSPVDDAASRPRSDVTSDPSTGEDPWRSWWRDAAELPQLAAAFEARSAEEAVAGTSAEYHPDQPELDRYLEAAGFGTIALRARRGASLLTIAST